MSRGTTSPTTISYIETSIVMPPLITYACISSYVNPKRKEQQNGGKLKNRITVHISNGNKPSHGILASLQLKFGTEEIVYNCL